MLVVFVLDWANAVVAFPLTPLDDIAKNTYKCDLWCVLCYLLGCSSEMELEEKLLNFLSYLHPQHMRDLLLCFVWYRRYWRKPEYFPGGMSLQQWNLFQHQRPSAVGAYLLLVEKCHEWEGTSPEPGSVSVPGFAFWLLCVLGLSLL